MKQGFTGRSLVCTRNGYIQLVDLIPGDEVRCMELDTNILTWGEVITIEFATAEADELYRLKWPDHLTYFWQDRLYGAGGSVIITTTGKADLEAIDFRDQIYRASKSRKLPKSYQIKQVQSNIRVDRLDIRAYSRLAQIDTGLVNLYQPRVFPYENIFLNFCLVGA